MGEDKLSESSFFDEKWLQAFGLAAENALDYFACSPFYDTTSVNEDIKRQGLDNSIFATTKGIQYHLFRQSHEPLLFVILKLRRLSKHHVENMAWYYVLDGIVYQAPTLERLVVSRLTKFSHHIHNAFDELVEATRFSPAQGYTWDFGEEKYDAWKQPTAGMDFERRRQLRDGHLERMAEADVNNILSYVSKSFIEKPTAE